MNHDERPNIRFLDSWPFLLGAAGTFFWLAVNINVTWKRVFALVFFVLAIDRVVVKTVAEGIKKREAEKAADEKAKS